MKLHTQRLILSKLSFVDEAFILCLLNEPGWIKYIGDRDIKNLKDARNYITQGPLESYERNDFGLMRIGVQPDNQAIGICGLLQRDYLDHPDIGYAMLSEFQGKGYAIEAAKAILEDAKTRLACTKVYAIVRPNNTRSIRMIEHPEIGMHLAERQHSVPQLKDLLLYELVIAQKPT